MKITMKGISVSVNLESFQKIDGDCKHEVNKYTLNYSLEDFSAEVEKEEISELFNTIKHELDNEIEKKKIKNKVEEEASVNKDIEVIPINKNTTAK